MNFGFDLEGTLDAEPDMFRSLCSSLMMAHHGVYVITAYYHPESLTDWAQESQRATQLYAIEFIRNVHYTEMLFASGDTAEQQGQRKLELCEDYQIRLMFEDRQVFADFISKATRTVMMVPRV